MAARLKPPKIMELWACKVIANPETLGSTFSNSRATVSAVPEVITKNETTEKVSFRKVSSLARPISAPVDNSELVNSLEEKFEQTTTKLLNRVDDLEKKLEATNNMLLFVINSAIVGEEITITDAEQVPSPPYDNQ